MKEVYDKVYSEVERYDEKMQYKIDIVETHIADLPKEIKIIDIGCGKGHYARSIQSWGYNDYTAIEFSTSCCEKYLQDIEYINIDFLDYGPTVKDKSYDLCLCIDVLEHISKDNINEFVANIARIGNKAILGIANHSDVFLGKELHIIQEGVSWWSNLLNTHFSKIECVDQSQHNSKNHPRFFMFVCES